MNQIAHWWDGVELWVTGLAFIPQVLVVMVVVVPLCALIARLVDLALAWVFRVLGRDEEPSAAAAAATDSEARS
ncbi:hypothetical protein G4X40_16885 [Rhodococcus sp. D2-41]|uniref:Uncharacterized protein n=1 Tax=Speluncibacter jeojiensis TaxID=2710754 RepID=A0A9X4LVY1_9ACTN|nr:hypothetical protein [Rhodococcus sp. D2-41]MDG3011823.1 hypothetical protein [Rhodococcus sp. D2-41]MDG3013275.1 hypothetical protein [Corynebacteriales bacterium D3-21]